MALGDVWAKFLGTQRTFWQIGLGGPQWKNNAGVIEARNPTDSGFVIGRGAPPVGANDWVTLGSLVSTPGVVNAIRFAIGTGATQTSATQIPANAIILQAYVNIQTPYSVGATISLGQVGNLTLLQAVGDNAPQTAGVYVVPDQDTAWGAAPLVVVATIAGAPVAGAGFVLVEYVVPNP